MKKKEKKQIAPNEASLGRWIAVLVVGYLLGQALTLILMLSTQSMPKMIMGIRIDDMQVMMSFVFCFATMVLILKVMGKTSLKEFVLGVGGKLNMKECLLVLGLFVVGYMLIVLPNLSYYRLRGVNAGEYIFLVVFMLLTAWTQTTWEELVFRGVVIRWACKNDVRFTKKALIAGIASSVAFALGHAGNPEVTSQSGLNVIVAVAAYAIPGIVFFLADLHFGSLMPSIVFHWINNFLLFTVFGTEGSAMPVPTLLVMPEVVITAKGLFMGSTLVYLPLLAYILFDILRKKKAPGMHPEAMA
jgi:membrane protease YdiL (CAAX protease family)